MQNEVTYEAAIIEANRAKEYLNQARGIKALLKVKQSELDELIKQLDSSPAQDVKVRTSTVSDKMKLVDVIVDYRAELLRETAALINLKKEIHGKINQLSKPIYIGILTEYYINARPWREISEILNISERHIYRIHGNALNEFRKKFNMI